MQLMKTCRHFSAVRSSWCTSLRHQTGTSIKRGAGAEVTDLDIVGEANACPAKFQSKFLQTLLERGFIHQCTDYKALDAKMSAEVAVPAYLGFDATAPSLHVGSLLQIMILRTLQKCGHKPIILIGGGTTKVGDPTGKDESRKLLSDEQIAANAASLQSVFELFLRFGDGPTDALLVNNADWLDKVNYIAFLRDYGKHFTVNRLLTFDSVKQRLLRTQPFSFLEFNYILLQSYDFLQLWRTHRVALQIGGSDQWGNIVSGVELARKVDRAQLFGLTAPLIATSDGIKMGKTEAGAVWLSRELLSEFDYWQFWRNTSDADVIRFLKLFTEVPLTRIEEMQNWQGSQLNAAKVLLADEATKLLHGENCLAGIHATVHSLFAKKGVASAVASEGNELLSSLTKVLLNAEQNAKLQNGKLTIVEILVHAQLAQSKAEARRMICAGAVKINDVKVETEAATVQSCDFHSRTSLKLSSSKKKHVLIEW
jgi:tyrosyl-tRNA synthetase